MEEREKRGEEKERSGFFQCVNPIRWPCQMRGFPKRDCGDYSVGAHLFPFRTEKLSPTAPMVLPYRWESRSSPNTIALQDSEGLFCFKSRPTPEGPGSPPRQCTHYLRCMAGSPYCQSKQFHHFSGAINPHTLVIINLPVLTITHNPGCHPLFIF